MPQRSKHLFADSCSLSVQDNGALRYFDIAAPEGRGIKSALNVMQCAQTLRPSAGASAAYEAASTGCACIQDFC